MCIRDRYKLAIRIKELCKEYGISFYELSYKSAVPMTTLMHIVNASTNNPEYLQLSRSVSYTHLYITFFLN